MKASTKLYLLVIVMSIFIMGIGLYGIREFARMNRNTQTLYDDRVIPMEQLNKILSAYTVGILNTAQKAKTNQITFSEARKEIVEAQKTITTNWEAYMLTFLTPEEETLAKQTGILIDKSSVTIRRLKTVLENKDATALDELIKNELYPAINPVISKTNELIGLQVSVSEEIYLNNREVYDTTSKRFYLIIILSLAIAIPFSIYIVKNIKDLLLNLSASNTKLSESEEKYRSLVEQAEDPIFILNEDRSIRDINSSLCKLLGYTHDELLQMKFSDLFPSEEIEKFPLRFELLDRTKKILSERKWKRKDTSIVEVEINVKVLEDKGYLGIARDITERKHIEHTLIESERKYRNIFENVQDVFFQTGLDGIIAEVSPSIKNHLGFNREELIGTQVGNLYFYPEDRIPWINQLKEKEVLRDQELRLKSKKGDLVYVSMNARIIHDELGNFSHIDGAFKDVTERKRMEMQLIENKEQLTLFIEHSPVSIAMFDTEMRYIATSRRWLSDYNLSGQQLEGKSHYEIFPGDIPEHWKEILQRCLNGAIEKNEEDSFIREDGRREWLRWEIHPWHKANKEIGGIIMFSELYTERKRATELFKYQFENSPDIILIINRDLKIESINRGLPGGRPPKDLIGLDSVAILPAESQGTVRVVIQKCFDTKQNQEVESLLPSGNWSRSRFVPLISDGEITHIMIISTDITHRKKAEEKLKQSEARLNEAQAIAHIGNFEVDMVQNIHTWSDEFYKILGFQVNEVAPSMDLFLPLIHPHDLDFVQKKIQEAYEGLKDSSYNFRFIRKDGSTRYGYFEWKFDFDKNHKPIRIYGIIQDATERKLAEQEREKMIADIIQQNKNFEEFAYIVSHNLRSPVSSILGIGNLLHRNLLEADRIKAQEFLFKEMEKLDLIVRDMNHVLEIRTDIAETKEVVHFSNLVKTITSGIKTLIKKQNTKIITDFSAIDQVTTLKGYLHSIFYNLISNSLKFERSDVDPLIEIKSELINGRIKISFKDNGRGIDLKRNAQNMFGLYKRFHPDVEGKGMGLFMVKTQLEVLGGSITVKSEPGVGSEFIVDLPV